MTEGRTINLYKGAQYIEHTESVVNNYYYGEKIDELDNAEIKEIIESLYELTDENGEKVFKDQDQWYAVFRVLSKLKSVPDSMSDFADFINDNRLAENKPKCVYNSIKKASSVLPNFAIDVTKWAKYKDASEQYKKQYIVAKFLLDSLENM